MKKLKAAIFAALLLLACMPAEAQVYLKNALRAAPDAFAPAAGDYIPLVQNGATKRLPADILGLNVRQFGAKCDVQYFSNDGTVTAGSNIFHSSQYTFNGSDVGKYIVIAGAGPSGAVLATTIAGLSGADAVLADNASTSIPLYQITAATPSSRGTGFVPGDTVDVPGATLQVTSTEVATIEIVSAGSGGTNGTLLTFDGTTGASPRRLAFTGTVSGGVLVSIDSLFRRGTYSGNPIDLNNEPVTVRPGTTSTNPITGVVVKVTMGVKSTKVNSTVSAASNPGGAGKTQTGTSGSGTGSVYTAAYTGQPTWYFGSDDGAAFEAAGLAAQGGAIVRVPRGICGTAKPVEATATAGKGSALFVGEGRGNTTIMPLVPMSWVTHRGATFAYGGGFKDMTIDAFKLADYGVYIDGGTQVEASPLIVKNAKIAEVRNGHSFANNYDFLWAWTDENIFRPDQRSQYNFWNEFGTDNHTYKILANNASEANIRDQGGGNFYVTPHTYGYPAPAYSAKYGVQSTGGQIHVTNHEMDGATIAGQYFLGQSFYSDGVYCQFASQMNVDGSAACVMIGINAKYGSITGANYNTVYPIPPSAIVKLENDLPLDPTVRIVDNGEATIVSDPSIPGTITANDVASGNSVQLTPGTRGITFLGPGTNMNLYGKGVSTLSVSNDNGVIFKAVGGTGLIANRMVINPAIAGARPTLSTEGSDTNIPLSLSPKGDGGVWLNSFLQFTNHSAPSFFSGGMRLFTDTSNRLSWIGTNQRIVSLDATGLTGDRVFTLPDVTGILVTSNSPTLTTPKIHFPTSCTGLASGDAYNNGTNIVPCP
jgi:hypothetical protein